MLKDETSLVLQNANNDKQIDPTLASIPTGKNELKTFFKVSTTHIEKQQQMHICIRCHVLSNHTLGNIKFQSSDGNLLAWLKKECICIELDNLGINQPVTIGHFTKIDSTPTHLVDFHKHLANQLMLVEIDADMAIKLALHLKLAQLEALTEFEVYRMHLT